MVGNVAIHRTAIIAPDVEIGDGTIVGPYAVLLAPCSVGRDCWIGPHVVLGTTAEHIESMTVADVPADASTALDDRARERIDEIVWFGAHGAGVIIGDHSTVREQSTVHQGTEQPTSLGDDVFVMNKSHVGHDARIGDRVRIAPIAMIGGHAWIGADANIGMASSIHQHRAIGTGAMIGMHATVVKDVGPFQLVKGNPARAAGVNAIGMARMGFTDAEIEELRGHYEGHSERPTRFESQFRDWERVRRR